MLFRVEISVSILWLNMHLKELLERLKLTIGPSLKLSLVSMITGVFGKAFNRLLIIKTITQFLMMILHYLIN